MSTSAGATVSGPGSVSGSSPGIALWRMAVRTAPGQKILARTEVAVISPA